MQECTFLKWLLGKQGVSKCKQTDENDKGKASSKAPHINTNNVEMLLNKFIFFKDKELSVSST